MSKRPSTTQHQAQAFGRGGDRMEARGAGASSGEGAPRRAPGIGASDLEQLKLAWLRAVALAWAEPAKLDLLKRDPAHFLEIHCGYALPRGLSLVVQDEQAASSSPDGAPQRAGGRATDGDSPQAQLTLRVPPPPKLEDQAIAMADLARSDLGDVLVAGCVPC